MAEEVVELRTFGQIHHYHLEFLLLVVEEDRALVFQLIRRLVEMGDVTSMETVVKVALINRVAQAPNRVLQAPKIKEELGIFRVAMGLEET